MTENQSTRQPIPDDETLTVTAPPEFTPGGAEIMRLIEISRVDSEWDGKPRDLLAWDFESVRDPDLHVSKLSSRATGKRSTARAIVQALTGAPVQPGSDVPLKALIGLEASIVLDADDEGWPVFSGIGPVPQGR